MLKEVIGTILKHRAGIAIGGAMIGVAVTAVMATKDIYDFEDNIADTGEEILNDMPDEEYEAYQKDEKTNGWNFHDVVKNYAKPQEKAIIFAKSFWKTGLAMTVTFALMIFSHVSMAKEIALTTAALGAISTKYKDLQSYLKDKYPEQYEEITRRLNRENARKKISEKGFKKEESYDGRKRYYFPLSDQIVFMKPEDMVKVQGFMSRTIGTEMELYLNDILDYIHNDLGYKDVHISDVDYKWAFPEDSVGDIDFPQILFEYDDVLDEDKSYVVCQVVTTSFDPEVVLNKSA